MKKRRFAAAFILLLALIAMTLAVPGSAQQAPPQVPGDVAEAVQAEKGPATYIVRMSEDPAVAYDGGVPGIPATKPGRGQKINPNNANVRAYVAHLSREHARVLRAAGARNSRLYDYAYSFNGFAATLTPAQAAEVAAMPGVVSVAPDETRRIETDNTPDFLGLTAEGGLWEQLGGQGSAGEDVVIGVIDTGIWPEHPSFADDIDGDRVTEYDAPPDGWHGDCDAGERFSKQDCNNKLIGSSFYRLGANASTVIPEDYLSARDKDGHGTHTASTAAGNAGVQAEVFGIDRGTVSGIAPRARIAAYKVCWNDAGCFLSDIVMAIDEAVADGVDVINYSIGGGPSLLGADDVAFLFAADAGVYIATSAGNSGPGPGTVGGPATVPWVTAVGASTHDRTFQGSVELSNGNSYSGASITGGTETLPLVDAEDAGDALCHPGALDPNAVSGNIVLCLRGEIARVDKSLAVQQAGGAGMVLYNASDTESQVTDNHWVPSVHINNTDGVAVKAYIDAEVADGLTPTATINGGEKVSIPAPWMASFSSRGPDVVAPDIIKPDITASGVNVLAGAGPDPFLGSPDQLFQAISGTSMSSPHVAGIYALLKQANPDWSPEMARSALMTTASQDVMKEGGVTPANPFDMGGGHATPNAAVDPGLVYDAGFSDYLQFLCGVGELSATDPLCETFGAIDPSDLNLASIGVAELAGFQTVTRTVTSVTPGTSTYTVSVDAPAGIDVAVEPSSITLSEGESASYEVTFTTTSSATLDEWAFGALTWSDESHSVRSPIAVRPVALAAPDEVFAGGTDGSLGYDVTYGYTGDFAAVPHGLIPAETQPGTVVDDPENDINAALATCSFASFPFTCTGITWHQVAAPAGTEYLRISLFDAYTDGADDLDLYVFDPSLGFVGSSGTPTSQEEVNIIGPTEETYLVAVHGWETDGSDASYTLFNWGLGAADSGYMTVSASSGATLGATDSVSVSWSGLAAGTKYLGSVTYHDVTSPTGYNDGLVDFTVVRVDTD